MNSEVLADIAGEETRTLTEYESKKVLNEYNIDCTREFVLDYDESKSEEDYAEEIREKRKDLSYPLFLKVSSGDIIHKTDAAVIAKVNFEAKAPEKCMEVLKNAKEYDQNAEIQGILISEDVSSREKRELVLGSTVDDQFGHVITLGIGGIATELYEDVSFRTIPVDKSDVRSMIDDLNGREMLKEFRGMSEVDFDRLIHTVLSFSNLIEENPEIVEVDVNPLFVGPEDVIAVDSIMKLSGAENY